MLDTCGCLGKQLGIAFNSKKSHCMTIGPHCISNIPNLSVNGSSMMWVDSLYLGVVIIASKKFKVDLDVCWRNLFAAVNCIYSRCDSTDVYSNFF